MVKCKIARSVKQNFASSNSGRLDWKVRKISAFQSFFLLRDIVLRLILKHFPHIP